MSSDTGNGLCNLDYADRYEAVLAENLPINFAAFGEFFAGTQRLNTLGSMLARHFTDTDKHVLNIGSGPFASEIFVTALQDQHITAIDYTPEFAPFHKLFRQDGHLKTTTFEQADAMTIEYPPDTFDLMVLHDVLYEPALDLEALVSRMIPFLKPDGILYLDFVNSRTLWIWTMLGKKNTFSRYDPRRVKAFFAEAGFELIDWRPTHGSKSKPVRLFHALLWGLFRSSNNYALLARKKRG